MPTQPIDHTVQGYGYKQSRRTQSDVDFSLGADQSKNRHESGENQDANTRQFIQSILSNVPSRSAGSVSFREIVEQYTALQSDWNRAVCDDLAELGVKVTAPFRLMYDTAGSISVAGEHGDKDMINAYFTANPSRIETFGEAFRLGKLADIAENRLTPSEMGQSLQVEALSLWYASNMDISTLYQGGGLLLGSGGGIYKGLDIMV
ncbi:hypothetical protein [Pseudodesulfovibrio sediminis]|uniref:Uncharacterized protein n=1 Tax=Pseudodesulfovibrio sediminis TaxID=2810563 RepID=A0ABN6ESS5_9BACT|nr:hypothetical protein [Pseudodesulfovibrio sediminis]BCS87928.1 hypothetical protein PSDVSF_11700 [Pseudodesulfovibrio sediminis]